MVRRIRRSWDERESGAATVEYAGMVIAVGALVVALAAFFTPLGHTISVKLCQAVASLGVDITCDAQTDGQAPTGPAKPPKKDEDYRPPACMYHEESQQYSEEFRLGFIKIGSNSGFIVQQFADGKVRITATDGATVGATGGFGGKFDIGKVKSGASVDFGGGLKFKYGDTWEFKDQAEYDKFKKQLDDYLLEQEMLKQQGGWAYVLVNGSTDPPPVPTTSISSIGFDASAKGTLGLKNPTGQKDDKGKDKYFDPNVGVNVEIKAGTDVVTKKSQNGDVTTTYEVDASGQAGASMVLPGGTAKGSTKGAFSITRDKDGKVTKIVFQTTREGSLGWNVGNNKSLPAGGSVSSSDGDSTVVTTTLDVDDGNRAVVDTWLNNTSAWGQGAQLALPWESMIPSKPSSDNPFQQLLYEQGTVNAVQYHNVKDKQGFDISVSLGFKVGLSLSMEEATADAVDATYLGAPGPDGVRVVVPDTKCVK